jgi:hypothetical protein
MPDLNDQGQPFVGGISQALESEFMEEALKDATRFSEPIWRLAGTDGWDKLKDFIESLVEVEKNKALQSETLDQMRFSQGFVLSLQRVLNFVESNAQQFEALQEDNLNDSNSPR